MTTYNFHTDVVGKQATSTPGEVRPKVRRGFCDTTKQALAAADIAQVVPIYAGEVVLHLWMRVITVDATSNPELDLGFAGGAQCATNIVVTTANAFTHNVTFAAIAFAANNYVTLCPQNGVAIDAGVFEVCALVVKSHDQA